MYERRGHVPLSHRRFALRLLRHLAIAVLFLLISLALGMWGYAHFEHLPWRDGFENSAMLLGGMGPVNNPVTPGGKIFAGVYALYAGLLFILTSGLVLAPVFHRMLHLFHCDERDK